MPKIKVQDIEFYYEIHGQGHPLMLISGYTRDHLAWFPILNDLSKDYQVVLFDNCAVGQTVDDGKVITAEAMAHSIMGLADALHLEQPHIAGHSMGGSIAQLIAAYYPNKIGKVAILSSTAKWRTAMLNALRSILAMRVQNLSFDLIFSVQAPWVYGEPFINNETEMARVKKAILDNPYPQSVEDQKRQFNVLETFDSRDELKKIKSKTLIVYGTQDILSLPYESHLIQQKIPHATRVELNCGHALALEKTKELVEILKSFY